MRVPGVGNNGDFGNTEGVNAFMMTCGFILRYATGGLQLSTNQKWYSPIVSVGCDNNPGKKAFYDEFGRMTDVKKLIKTIIP